MERYVEVLSTGHEMKEERCSDLKLLIDVCDA